MYGRYSKYRNVASPLKLMTQQDAGVPLLKMSCDWLAVGKAGFRGTRVPFAERDPSNFVASQQTCRAKRKHPNVNTSEF